MKKNFTSKMYLILSLSFATSGLAQSPVTPAHSLFLNGGTQYMKVASNPILDIADGQSKTITFWFKTSGITSTPRLLAKRASINGTGQSTPGTTGTGYELWMNASNNLAAGNANAGISATTAQAFSTQGYNATAALNNGVWHHAALVFDNATPSAKSVTYYIDAGTPNFRHNGTPGQQLFGTGTYDFSTGVDLVVGASCNVLPGGGASKFYFTGAIDDLRIYDVKMTQAELAAEMTAAATSSTPNLIAAWDFETVAGDQVADIKGSLTGTLVGSPLLPITLKSFSGQLSSNRRQVNLNWNIETEINVMAYEIEQSSNGTSFTKSGNVVARGNSGLYNYAATTPAGSANVFYRLRVVDNDGKTSYTNILRFQLVGKQILSVYPNPASQHVNISTNINGKATLQIIAAASGKTVQTITVPGNAFFVNIESLPAGSYLARLVSESGVEVTNFIKQ